MPSLSFLIAIYSQLHASNSTGGNRLISRPEIVRSVLEDGLQVVIHSGKFLKSMPL
jgi:hypothetical protein